MPMLATAETQYRSIQAPISCQHCHSRLSRKSLRDRDRYCGAFCYSKALEQDPSAQRYTPKYEAVTARLEAKTVFSKASDAICTGVLGSCGELMISVDLMRRGYEVFRAVSPACSCDLIALKGGQSYRVEVRTSLKGQPKPTSKDTGRYDIFATVTGGTNIEYQPAVDGYVQ